MAFSRGLDFLSTWLVTPRLELEANPLMRRAGFIRMALLNLPQLELRCLRTANLNREQGINENLLCTE